MPLQMLHHINKSPVISHSIIISTRFITTGLSLSLSLSARYSSFIHSDHFMSDHRLKLMETSRDLLSFKNASNNPSFLLILQQWKEATHNRWGRGKVDGWMTPKPFTRREHCLVLNLRGNLCYCYYYHNYFEARPFTFGPFNFDSPSW